MAEDVVERIEKLLNDDLVRLLDSVEEADEALLEFESGKRKVKATAAPPPPRRGEKKTAPPRPPRNVSPRHLRVAWDAVHDAMLAHVERERTLVLPGCLHVVQGMEQLRGGLQAPVRQMVNEHREITDKVLAVRLEASRVEPVRREFLLVCRLWDEHVQAEESFVFPEALAELTEEVSVISRTLNLEQDVDSIGARLRLAAARKSAAEPEPEPEPQGVMGRFFSFLDRGKR